MKISFLKIVLVLFFFLSPFAASAGMEHNLIGWAWSSNIGWISFNSTNDHNPDLGGVQPSSVDYGVNKDASGNLVGYAWSSNIGWIKFGGFSQSDFPSGSGTREENANVIGGGVRGWVKALSADGKGWDGWISLAGTKPKHGVTFNLSTGYLGGYAWGSDVVGWVDFLAGGPTDPPAGGSDSGDSRGGVRLRDFGDCSDGAQNGTETWIDYGGRCAEDGQWTDWVCVNDVQTRSCIGPEKGGRLCTDPLNPYSKNTGTNATGEACVSSEKKVCDNGAINPPACDRRVPKVEED